MDHPKRILIVEDDVDIANVLSLHLRDERYEVVHSADGNEGLRLLEQGGWDALILDLMLPGVDGLEICRRARAMTRYTPIIITSARSSEVHRILGLELGADDYLAKPCNPRELLARVRAVLRRNEQRSTSGGVGAGCEFAGWRLDLVRRELRSPQGVVVNLSSGEFSLLRAFVERPQRVLTRDQLLEFARGPDSDAFDRAIDVQISRLRRKLDDSGQGQELIRTVRNEGYIFTPKVSRTP
jgi:two-component system OmpR family response regulator